MIPVINSRTDLLNALWAFQHAHGYIRDEDVHTCSESLGVSQVEIEGVISFYHFFHRKPHGQFTVYLNNSIVSQFKGFERVKTAFERETGTTFGRKEPNGPFGLYETACIGLSDQEPAALINFVPFTHLNSLKVKEIVSRLQQGASVESLGDAVPDNIRRIPDSDKTVFFRDYEPGRSVAKLKGRDPDAIINEIKNSNLAGMGGAFFPTGMKWDYCRQQSSSPKYVVCNADEGEPGTFKDRVLMNALPGLMLEGMIIGGYAIGSNQGIIYLRAEYSWLKERIESAIHEFRDLNLLGQDVGGIGGFNFDIRIQLGAGAYVCGEETALLNSLEGKRGEPRARQFYPTEKGFLGQPTIVNNVETFCGAARVIELGSVRYLKSGTGSSSGTKVLSVSGDCRLPGIYEIEWGTTVAELLERCRAEDPYLVQISGPSGECLCRSEFGRQFSLDDLRCGGSVMVFNRSRDILQILCNFADFFKHESCGVCTPCRAGNFIVQRKLEKIRMRHASKTDFEELKSWGRIMEVTSRCGLGAAATNSLTRAIDKFPDYFESRIGTDRDGIRSDFDLEKAVREYDVYGS